MLSSIFTVPVQALDPEELVQLIINDIEDWVEKPVRFEVKHKLLKIKQRLEKANEWISTPRTGGAKDQIGVAIDHLSFLEEKIPFYDVKDPDTADSLREMDLHDAVVVLQIAYDML